MTLYILRDLRGNRNIKHDTISLETKGVIRRYDMALYILRDLRGNQKITYDTLYP